MVLNFTPPEWLIQDYMKRRTPVERAAEGVGQAVTSYAAMDNSEQKRDADNLSTYVKAYEAGGPSFAASVAKQLGMQEPGKAAPAKQSPLIAFWNQMKGGASPAPTAAAIAPETPAAQATPAPTATPGMAAESPSSVAIPGIGDPLSLLDQGKWGANRLDAAEKIGRYQSAMYDAEDKREMRQPVSFDYATSLTPKGMEDVTKSAIENAKKEGLTALPRAYWNDIQKSWGTAIGASGASTREGLADAVRLRSRVGALVALMNLTGGQDLKSASAEAGKRWAAVQRAIPILDQIKSQGDSATKRQAADAAISVARILTGSGVVTNEQMNEFIPKTLRTKYRDVSEYLTNESQTADFSTFRKEFEHLIQREDKVNKDIMSLRQEFGDPAFDILDSEFPGLSALMRAKNKKFLQTPSVGEGTPAPAGGGMQIGRFQVSVEPQ